MNRRTIHPIAPWLIAGILIISGGIVFRVWAQQGNALAPGSGSGSAIANAEPEPVARLGSIILPQSAGESTDNPRVSQSADPSKIAASPSVPPETSAGSKPPGSPGEAHIESTEAHAATVPPSVPVSLPNSALAAAPTAGPTSVPTSVPTTASTTVPISVPVQGGQLPLAQPAPSGVATDPQQQTRFEQSNITALLIGALAGTSFGAAEESGTSSAKPRLIKVSQVLQIVYIEWALEEKMTPLLTQNAAQRDVAAILSALHTGHSGYRLVHLIGHAPRVGPAAPPDSPPQLTQVLWLTYDAAEIERIDWGAHPAAIARTIYDHAAYVRTE